MTLSAAFDRAFKRAGIFISEHAFLVSDSPENVSWVSKDLADLMYRWFLGFRVLYAARAALFKPSGIILNNTKRCSLQCEYCYSESSPDADEMLDPEFVVDLFKKFNFSSALLLGGDPIYVWEYNKRWLAKIPPLKSLEFSTNGTHLNDDVLQDLDALFGLDRVSFQLSLEPSSWASRTAKNRIHQNAILAKTLARIKRRLFFNVAVTIPEADRGIDVRLSEFQKEIDYMLGHHDWSFRVKSIETEHDAGESPSAAQLIRQWFSEDLDRILDKRYARPDEDGVTIRKSFANEWFFKLSRGLREEKVRAFFGLTGWGCQAGFGSVSVSYDGTLSTCHKASFMPDTGHNYVLTVDATPKVLLEYIVRDAMNMNNAMCRQCFANGYCGGVCYSGRTTSACDLARHAILLGFAALKIYSPNRFRELEAQALRRLKWFASRRADMERLVNSDGWGRLVDGSATAEDVAILVGEYFSMPDSVRRLDKKLWELPPPAYLF